MGIDRAQKVEIDLDLRIVCLCQIFVNKTVWDECMTNIVILRNLKHVHDATCFIGFITVLR